MPSTVHLLLFENHYIYVRSYKLIETSHFQIVKIDDKDMKVDMSKGIITKDVEFMVKCKWTTPDWILGYWDIYEKNIDKDDPHHANCVGTDRVV